jgi:hypothetical protein
VHRHYEGLRVPLVFHTRNALFPFDIQQVLSTGKEYVKYLTQVCFIYDLCTQRVMTEK